MPTIDSFKSIAAAEKAGEWVDDIQFTAGVRLRVRPVWNADYRRVFGEIVKALPANERDGIDAETDPRVAPRLYAETVLTDWDLTENDGTPLQISPQILSEFPDLLADVAFAANYLRNKRRVSQDEATKN